MNIQPISALIITKNEEKNIGELIENLSFADEIVVIDSFSTDQTADICSSYKQVKFYQHPFKDYSSQRNIAITYASHEWILFLDADERLSEALKNEIQQTIQQTNFDAFFLKRTFFFENTPLKFGGLQNDRAIRLFKKSIGKFHKLVHEKLSIENANVGQLKNPLNHYSYNDYSSFKNKLLFYGQLKGKEAHAKGKNHNWLMHTLHPTFTFINRFIFRLGFLDGIKGGIICYLMSLSVWERYNELKRLQK